MTSACILPEKTSIRMKKQTLNNIRTQETRALTKTTYSLKTIPLTLSWGCWELTIHVVDLEAGQVLGCAGLGGRKQRRVMDWEVTVVVL